MSETPTESSIPNPRRLWLQSPAAERKALAAEMARLKGNPAWPQLEAMIGAAIGFRPATLRKAKPAQLAIWIGEAAGRLSDELLEQLLVLVHFEGRQEMLSSVYDAFGIEHDGAEVEEEVLDAPVDPKKAKKGIAALAKSSDRDQLRTCLAVMGNACTEAWRPAVEAAWEEASKE